MPLTDKELNLIIRALRAYADFHFIDYLQADWLATRLSWVNKPAISISNLNTLQNHGKKAY